MFVGGGQSLGVCGLFELRNFAVTNTEGHDPAIVEHATRGLDSTAGPTGDEDPVSFRHGFVWFEGFDSNLALSS